jgi:hypothetical protein
VTDLHREVVGHAQLPALDVYGNIS